MRSFYNSISIIFSHTNHSSSGCLRQGKCSRYNIHTRQWFYLGSSNIKKDNDVNRKDEEILRADGGVSLRYSHAN